MGGSLQILKYQYIWFITQIGNNNITLLYKISLFFYNYCSTSDQMFKVLKPVSYDSKGLDFISAVDEEQELPLYLGNKNLFYWYNWIDHEQTLYFQYNHCAEVDTLSFKKFMNGMLEFIENQEVEKFIFDMRLNGGGNSSIAEPLIKALKIMNRLTRKENCSFA